MPLPKGYTWSNTAVRMQANGYVQPSREEIDIDKEDFKATQQLFSEWDWQNEDGLGPQGEPLPNGAQGWKPNGEADYGAGLKGWWNKFSNRVKDAWDTGYEQGLQISGVTKFAVEKLNPVDSKNKDAAQTLKEMEEARKPKTEGQAQFAAAAEATKEVFNQALWGVLDGLSQVAIGTERVLGTAGYTLADMVDQFVPGGVDREVNAETFRENWEASRMAYSNIFDASIHEEMNRRIDAGMRGDLAQQEIMTEKKWTMWPEMIGQMIFDPLNVISAWGKPLGLGKEAAAIRLEKKVAKTFREVQNPAVLKMLDDVENLDDATAYARIDELVKTQQGLLAATSHAEDIAQAGKDLEALSTSYKLSSMTADGKRAHVASQTGEILMHVVNNSSPDEALEILRGMVKSTSSKADEAAEGLSTMLHFADPKALFSEAGNKTTVMLSRMTEKYGDDWLKNIEALKGDPAALTKDLLTKLDDVGEEMFPSVTSMLEAEKAVKAGGEVTEKVRALAQRANQLPQYVKNATRFHDAAQKVVGPINKFFVGAYMGWSPGFAFRNFSNNSLQLLIDYGPGVLLGKADDMFSKAEKLHGGILQGAFSEGGQAAALFPDTAKLGENARNTGFSAIVDAAKQKGLSGPVLGMSQTLEANAAKRIIAKTYTKTFEQGTKAMVKALTPDLKAAGFSDDIIRKLPTLISQNDGDAVKVINALREEVSSGVIDLFNDASRIDPKYQSFLNDVGKWDEYSEQVLKAPTREAAQAAAQKIFDEIAQAGDYVYREGRAAVDNYDKFLKMAEKADLPPNRGQLISLRKTESRKAIQVAESILAEADDLGAQMGLQVGSLKKARGITGLNTWGNDAAKEADRLNDLVWQVSDASKKNNANLTQLWATFSPDPMPQVLDAKMFRDALWAKYDEVVSKTWGGARDTAMDSVTGYLDDLKAAGVEVPDEWRETIKAAQEGAQQYDTAMVGRFGELVEETPMEYGTRSTQISTLANKYGISTATEAGAPMDKKILSTINKYAETTYKSLEEVPLSVAEEALAKKAGQLTPTQTASRLETPEFKNWFGDSKVVDDEGKPLVMYHATGEDFTSFKEGQHFGTREQSNQIIKSAAEVDELRASKGMPPEKSSNYRTIPVYLSIKNPLRVSDDVSSADDWARIIEDAKAKGHDGIVYQNWGEFDVNPKTGDAADSYIAFKSEQVKSVSNPGTFDPNNADILDSAHFNEAGELVEPTRSAKRILPPPTDGELPPVSRAIYEQKDAVRDMRAWVMDDITKNYGKKQVADKLTEQALSKAQKELTQKLAETRLISSRVAQANRDFTLLNYGEKSYWDVAAAYLYPFHYWYKGTYKNWLSRVASNPAILGHYSRYKETLGTVHAGMPEWWKYNINTNDLPGVDVENPLYFNLEATLWPLNGITGMDFNDRSKVTNWWTHTLDFANKFGPSTWSPISMMTGLALYNQGEKEAGMKWLGRLIPQSATIKAVASRFGVGNLETDPIIKLFGENDLDPYEQRRVNRALAAMQQEAERGELQYTPEQIIDAAYSQEGEIWDEAVKRAVHGRSGSQISSYLFGVGFKGRTEEDKQVDQFYTDYSKLWKMRPNLSTEEFREGMDAMKQRYPFMDAMLLSSRNSEERDAGLAYNVLTRIPPGQSGQIAEAVGIDGALFDKFFATKGQLKDWSPADRQKFMAGVLTMSAVLEIPKDMTRAEWTKAKNAYTGLTNEAKGKFGDDILDMVDAYYAAKTNGKGTDYLDDHPEVSQYMDWKAQRVMQSPLLSAYYGGASQIEGYFRSQMYNDIETQLGEDIFDVVEEYNTLKTFEPSEAKAYYRQHKAEIRKYYDIKDSWQHTIDKQTAVLASQIPDAQGASIREDYDATSPSQQGLVNSLQPEEQPTLQDFQATIPQQTMSLIYDYYSDGERLPEAAQKQLDRIAKEMGYEYGDELLQAVGIAIYEEQP